MTFTEVTIKVPEGMTMYLHPKNPQAELQRNALLLYPYINDKTISHGKAAEILGIPKYDLIELIVYGAAGGTCFGNQRGIV